MLKWKRSEAPGYYADSANELLRYYVFRQGRDWTLEVIKTIETSGIRTVKPGRNPVETDRFHSTAKLAKLTAEAYDAEPIHSGPQNRITRAIDRGYSDVVSQAGK